MKQSVRSNLVSEKSDFGKEKGETPHHGGKTRTDGAIIGLCDSRDERPMSVIKNLYLARMDRGQCAENVSSPIDKYET